MMTKVFFQNNETGMRYEVVSIDKDAGTLNLRGEFVEFTEPFDKVIGPVKTFAAFNYSYVVEDQADDV